MVKKPLIDDLYDEPERDLMGWIRWFAAKENHTPEKPLRLLIERDSSSINHRPWLFRVVVLSCVSLFLNRRILATIDLSTAAYLNTP